MAARHPLVIGVFQDEAGAKKALERLRDAGFEQNQLGLAWNEGGAMAVDLKRDLMNLGVPEAQADFYDQEFRAGRPVLSVRAEGREQQAASILTTCGADNIVGGAPTGYAHPTKQTETAQQETRSTMGERGAAGAAGTAAGAGIRGAVNRTGEPLSAQRGATEETSEHKLGYRTEAEETRPSTRTSEAAAREQARIAQQRNVQGRAETTQRPGNISQQRGVETTQQRGPQAETGQSIPLREEQVHLGKERVESGEVTIGKEVVSEEKHFKVPVSHEEVVIERHPVSGEHPTSEKIGEGETIHIPLSEERVNISKETVVGGEVTAEKREVQGEEDITETVRHEEPRIQREGHPHIESEGVEKKRPEER